MSISAFFSYAFRPFFLLGSLYAAVAMAAWLTWIGIHAADGELLWISTDFVVFRWHAHEMVFGYTLAAVAGFFLTAVPGWTGRKPAHGLTLAALVAVWIAGRAAVWFSTLLPAWAVATIDGAFAPFLLILVVRALGGGWSRRNVIFMPIIAGLIAANALVHLERLDLTDDTMATGHLLAIDMVLVLIGIIGGRIVPAFTTNQLRKRGETRLPVSRAPVEAIAVLSLVALALADLIVPGEAIVGWIAFVAALVHAVRFVGWRGHRVLDEPLLWVIHLGYVWLIAGLAMKGAALTFGSLAEATALHLLTVGAVGSMTLGVMTRAALGHTGRALRAPKPMVVAYVLISAAALARAGGPVLVPTDYNLTMLLAGALWIGAFAIYFAVFLPILTTPRPGTEQEP